MYISVNLTCNVLNLISEGNSPTQKEESITEDVFRTDLVSERKAHFLSHIYSYSPRLRRNFGKGTGVGVCGHLHLYICRCACFHM